MTRCSSPLFLALAASLPFVCARAEYHYFSNVPSGSDGIVQEVRWPYWNSAYYNTWLSDDWTSAEGTSGYFYSGLALPAAGAPNPVGTKQTVNWSFWPLSSPVNVSDTISSYYTSPGTFSMQTIGEGTILRSPGSWTLWQTNVWYRMAFRTWQPPGGIPHLGYAGIWMRDPVAAVWYHQATVQLPFAVTGIDGLMGFQENASGGSQPQRTDYRGCYYHKNGVWGSGNQFYIYNHGGGIENVGLIETNTAVYYETCKSNGVYTGTITNVGQSSPTFTITQPATPTFDPILVTSSSASVSGGQLLVQWQLSSASSPQFAYQVDVYTNASYTGTVAVSFYNIAPEARQKLLNLGGVTTAYPRLTIIDIFSQTNAAISLAPTNANLNAASSPSGVVNGLNFSYYQSASNYTLDSSTNWSAMPNFGSMTPLLQGAVSGLDLTPRQRRQGYAFNYTGYLNVPSDGLYAFTLNSEAGSKLYLDGQLVVNNDGLHSPTDLSGWIGLQPGYHSLNVQYFCDTQSALFGSSTYFDTLSLYYEGPGISKTLVPVSAFYRAPGGTEPSISLTSPANNSTVSAASVPLAATVAANGSTINKVQFYNGSYFWAQDAASPFTANSFLWASASNPLRARLIYNATNVVDSPVNLVTTTNSTIAPWQCGQIFYHNQPSGVSVQGGTYSLIGDGVNLLTRQVSGDCTLIAHLAGITSTAAAPDGSTANTGWQAGIILRGTTNMTPGYPWGQTTTAPFTAVFGQVGGGTYCQDETMVNGGGGYSSGNLGGQKWFKIQRLGNTFTSSVSADGNTWTTVKTNTLSDFGTALYAGFFTYAGPSSNPNVHWASFDNLSLTGNILGPPRVSVTPQSDTSYVGQNVTFTAAPSGASPFTYQWQSNSVSIPGATNVTLVLTILQPAASGLYTVLLSNSNGSTSATATLTVLAPPAPVSAILSNNPAAYWRLNEATGPTAYDSAGPFNGTGEGGIVFGVPGVTNAPFTGFEHGNVGAQFNGTDSDAAIPAMNLNTDALTIAGWIKRSGTQTSWSGIVFCRSGSTASGLHFGTANELRYTWNNSGSTYNWNSGLTPPDGVWTFFALAIEPTRTIMYMATNATLQSATNNVANAVQAFAGTTYLGYDPNSSARRINGALDEVAIYNRTLTAAQINQMLSASLSARPPAVKLTAPASGASYGAPGTINLVADVITNGHSITQVQFFNGSSLLGQATTSPYAYTWIGVPAGAYTLLAQVAYDTGATVFSAPVFITVTPIPLAPATVAPTVVANNLISVTWSPAANATGYILSRGGTPVAWASGTNYLDLGLSPSTTYCYSVVATNAFGSLPSSVTNCATTSGTAGALSWDAGGAAGAQDGNGNWGTTGASWWNGSASVLWANNSLAVFGAGATTNCSVVLTNDVTPSGILFNANGGGSYSISSTAGALNLSGTPTITANDNASITAYLKGGGLVKAGPGTLTLSGGNTNTGSIAVNGGKLLATGGGWYASRSIGSGSLTINSGATAEFTLAHGFGVSNGGQSATVNGGTLQFDLENYVSGLTLNGGSVIGGGQFRALGTTYAISAATASSVISTPIALYGSPTFNVAKGAAGVDLLLSGKVSPTGSYAMTKSGAGLMRCTGNITNYGTTIGGGTLQVDGLLGTNIAAVTVQNTASLTGVGVIYGPTAVQSGGSLAPGDSGIGTLSFSNSVTLNAGSKAIMEISKSGNSLSNDLAKISGTLNIAGSLVVTNAGTNAFVEGDNCKLFSAGTFAGAFTGFTLPALATNLTWDTSKIATNGTLTVVALPRITSQPKSLTVDPDSLASFTVSATGTGSLGYQWCKNGGTIENATGTSYTIAKVTASDAASYTVVVTNAYGSTTSQVATLTVRVVSPLSPTISSVAMLTDGSLTLSGTGAVGQAYTLVTASNLAPPIQWAPGATNKADASGSFGFTDLEATNYTQRYYRVLAQ